jgi:hypothetical protein
MRIYSDIGYGSMWHLGAFSPYKMQLLHDATSSRATCLNIMELNLKPVSLLFTLINHAPFLFPEKKVIPYSWRSNR